MIQDHKWILYSKYFAGECSRKDMDKIESLLKKKESDRQLFTSLKRDNEMIEKYKKMKTVDVDKAWNNVSQRIQAAGGNIATPVMHLVSRKHTGQRTRWIAIAASILIIAGLFFTYRAFISPNSYNNKYITVNSIDTDSPVTLPDGSKVYLNRKTRISYPNNFSSNTREIILNGEAFFEVSPDASSPFVVKTGRARVKVLGTTFLVNDRAGKNTVEVFVESGKVQVYLNEKENQALLLEKGDIGRLSQESASKFANKNENIIAWKTKRIVFSHTRLSEVIEVLQNVYGQEIRIVNKEALDWSYSNTITNQSLESVIKVLAETFQFKVNKDRSVIVLSGGIN